MCGNCSLQLPVPNELIEKYNLPKNSILSRHELEEISIKFNGSSIDMDYVDDVMFNTYSKKYYLGQGFTGTYIINNIIDTPYGFIKTGFIIENTSYEFQKITHYEPEIKNNNRE